MSIELRDYQAEAVERLRENIRNDMRNQILAAPTGSGKTVIAAYLIDECERKGKNAVFVCDRIQLIDQTSATFDEYGIDHGVIQAEHWRKRPWKRIQVASAQTLGRRGWPEKIDLIVVDEAHALYKDITNRIGQRDCVVIGLTATPFTKGLGKLYDGVVTVRTTNELIAEGYLSPFRVFAASEPDMEGAKVVAGEWTDEEAAKRSIPIVGDCVAEYLKHGDGKKFIAFGVNVQHCEELQKQFMAAGVQCELFTYHTPDEQRRMIVDEFRKRDSYVRGLVSVSALSKGFDVADVEVVILARPLRKSLAEHIQMIGRGLRPHPDKKDCIILDHAGNCIASGQRVLTHRGLVPIEQVRGSDLLWDGHEYVTHGGVVYRGRKRVIEYAGLAATPDHRVKTLQGWRAFGSCAKEQASIRTTAIGRTAIRECDNYLTSSDLVGRCVQPKNARPLRVHDMRVPLDHRLEQSERWTDEGLPFLQPAEAFSEMAVCTRSVDATPLHEAECERVDDLRWSRYRISVHQPGTLCGLDSGESRNTGKLPRHGAGPDRRERPLRAGQRSVGYAHDEHEQHTAHSVGTADAPLQDRESGNSLRRRDATRTHGGRADVRANSRTLPPAVEEAERDVWDILDAGPRNSFTCEGLLVHNCMRFWDQMQDFFENGCTELDDGKRKDKKAKPKKERQPVKCSKCFHVHKPSRVCPACGFEYPRRSQISHVEGELMELTGTVAPGGEREALYAQLLWIAHDRRYKTGWAAHKYRERTGAWPTNDMDMLMPQQPTPQLLRWVRSRMIAFAKGTAA